MANHGTKQDALNAVDADERQWSQLVEAVGLENMEVPGAMGDWTFKDLAAHVNGWRESSLNRLESDLTGAPRKEPWPSSIDRDDYDKVNDWLHEQNRDRPISDVLADTRALSNRVRALIAAIPEEKLFDPSLSPDDDSYGVEIASGEFFSHLPDEHLPDVNAWLKSLGKSVPQATQA